MQFYLKFKLLLLLNHHTICFDIYENVLICLILQEKDNPNEEADNYSISLEQESGNLDKGKLVFIKITCLYIKKLCRRKL